MARVTLEGRGTARLRRLSVAPIVAQLRRLRDDTPLIGIVVGVVLVTSFVFAAIPRLFNDMADDGLRYAVDGSRSFLRNIQMARASRIAPARTVISTRTLTLGRGVSGVAAPSIQRIIGADPSCATRHAIFLDLPDGPRHPSPRHFNLR
jgi:hypothetical protein